MASRIYSLSQSRDMVSFFFFVFVYLYYGNYSDETYPLILRQQEFKRTNKLVTRSNTFADWLDRCNRSFYSNSFFFLSEFSPVVHLSTFTLLPPTIFKNLNTTPFANFSHIGYRHFIVLFSSSCFSFYLSLSNTMYLGDGIIAFLELKILQKQTMKI